MILTVYTTIYGFVDQGDSRQSIEDAFFVVFQGPIRAIEVAQYYIYITQTLIGDAFMVSVFVTPDCWVVFMPPPGLSHLCSVER